MQRAALAVNRELAFDEAWLDPEFVQEVLAQLPWYHHLALLDKLPDPQTRKWIPAATRRRTLIMLIWGYDPERCNFGVNQTYRICPMKS